MAVAPVYIFSSDDPFLKNEQSGMVIASARAELPEAEFLIFTNDDFSSGATANLARLENELMDPGLFGGDRIIKIYLSGPNATAFQVLMLIARRLRPGVVIVIDMPRIKKTLIPAKAESYKDKLSGGIDTRIKHAFAFLMDVGARIEVLYPPTGNKFYDFIVKRAARYSLRIDDDALSYLALACEGNLNAVDQFFAVMRMSFNDSTISFEMAKSYMSSSSRYSGYEFAEAVLAPNTIRALNILSSLKQTSKASSQIISQVISNFDRVLKAVADGRIDPDSVKGGFASQIRRSFFASHGIVSLTTQDVITYAVTKLPEDFFCYLTEELAKAARAMQVFDEDTAINCLENMAVSVSNPTVRSLKEL